MPLYVNRKYYNDNHELIRTDNITMEPTNTWTGGSENRTYYRAIRINPEYHTGVPRIVRFLEIETNGDTIESVTGDYEYVTWSTHSYAKCDMSDLPGIGDTVS